VFVEADVIEYRGIAGLARRIALCGMNNCALAPVLDDMGSSLNRFPKSIRTKTGSRILKEQLKALKSVLTLLKRELMERETKNTRMKP
jgi:hypothetical protein